MSNIYLRGQIWHWIDPIYGPKRNKKSVHVGESTFRYNRYVLIVQSECTIDDYAMLVVPLSTKITSEHDVPIKFSQKFCDSEAFARVRFTFPIHPACLDDYICTLDDDTMKSIDAELIKLILPRITNTITSDAMKTIFGLSMEADPVRVVGAQHNAFISNIEETVKLFFNNCVTCTNDKNDIISRVDMKLRFDEFCRNNNIIVENNIVKFIKHVKFAINNNKLNSDDVFSTEGFKGVKFKDSIDGGNIDVNNVNNVNNVNKAETKETTKKSTKSGGGQKKSRKKWDEEKMKEYLAFYISKGKKAAAKKYHLTQMTAETYYYLWRKELEVTEIDINDPALMKLIPETVSKVSNLLQNDLENSDLYSRSLMAKKSERNHHEFYNIINTNCYKAMLESLGIKRDHGDFSIEKYEKDGSLKNVDFWTFLVNIRTDKDIDIISNQYKYLMQLHDKYKDHYSDKSVFPPDFISNLSDILMNDIRLVDFNVDTILKELKVFCYK